MPWPKGRRLTIDEMNARPHEDLVLRDVYRLQNPRCEIYETVLTHLPRRMQKNARPWSVEVHHIVHHCGRIDVLSNLIAVSADIHIPWGHAHPVDFRIVCLHAKLRKRELSVAELNACFGAERPDAQPLIAWIEGHAGSAWLERMQDELLTECYEQTGAIR